MIKLSTVGNAGGRREKVKKGGNTEILQTWCINKRIYNSIVVVKMEFF
jgi:hypothetical protein